MPRKDLTGQRFGRLTVNRVNKPQSNRAWTWWVCCDCGHPEFSVLGYNLTSGNSRSCGCLKRELASERYTNDLTGRKFGQLTVVRRNGSDKRYRARWTVQCACGSGEFTVLGSSLTSRNTLSCGCLHKLVMAQALTKDLTGQTFGLSTVLRRDGMRNGNCTWWIQCACGSAEVSVLSSSLLGGHSHSCGCMQGAPWYGVFGSGFLYIVRLSSETEQFLKVGVAGNVERRIQQYRRDGFEVQVIYTIFGRAADIYAHERIIHGRSRSFKPSLFAASKYWPVHKFDGRTECYEESALLDICEYVDDCSDYMHGRLC
jgi:hypothetical protein